MEHTFSHISVLLHECIEALNINPNGIYVDCTLGGGGHSELILKKISPNGKLISFDIDDEAIAHAGERLKTYENLTIKDLSLLLKILSELKETKEEIEVL